jgi:hypothetical protein
MSDDYLRQRAGKASRESYDNALAAVPDVDPEPHDRLTGQCAKLNLEEEHALAEEDIAAALETWPTCSDELREELEHRIRDQAVSPGAGRSWPEVKARLLPLE